MKPLNAELDNATIMSNTSDTIVLESDLSVANYATIDGYTQKYTIVDIADSFNVKLQLFESGSLVTDLVPNSLSGKTIRLYNASNITAGMILGGSDNIIYSGGNISSIASTNNTISNGGGALIGASNYNNINIFSMTSILSGLLNYVSNGTNSAIIAARGNYITNTEASCILGSDGNYIIESVNACILGGRGNHINDGVNSSVLFGNGNYINNSDISSVLCGSGNHINDSNNSSVLCGSGNYIENLTNVSIISCDNMRATRHNVLMTSSLTLVNNTLELMGKTPNENQTLVVKSIADNVATLDWGNVTGGNDMTPIDINGDQTNIAYYNSDPSKVVYSFNCDILDAKTGNCRKTIHLNNDTVYPIGTIIYIILFRVASPTSTTPVVPGIYIDCGGGSGYGFSSDSVGISCRTVAFQKVLAKEWLMLRAS
jgi:hypothetical protein